MKSKRHKVFDSFRKLKRYVYLSSSSTESSLRIKAILELVSVYLAISLQKVGGRGGRGLKNTRPLSKPTPLLPRQRRSWGLAFVMRIRTPDPRISSSSFEERTQLRHISWFRDPHCAFLISDQARRLSQVNLLHDRAHQPLFFSWLTQNQTANVLVQPFLLVLQHINLFAHEKLWGFEQSKLAGEWSARRLFHY